MRVCIRVLRPEAPKGIEVVADEERGGERQAAAERLPDAENVGGLSARPQLTDPPEPGEDRVDDEQRADLVAAPAQRLDEPVGRDA